MLCSIKNSQEIQSSQEVKNYGLICSASILLHSIWNEKIDDDSFLKLNEFIITILKRSKCSNLTLKVSLYYLIKLSNEIKINNLNNVFICKRRTFLTCLIIASKFVQDRNFSMKSWSLISGLSTMELIQHEKFILKKSNYNLFIREKIFNNWNLTLEVFVSIFLKNKLIEEIYTFWGKFLSSWNNENEMVGYNENLVNPIIVSC